MPNRTVAISLIAALFMTMLPVAGYADQTALSLTSDDELLGAVNRCDTALRARTKEVDGYKELTKQQDEANLKCQLSLKQSLRDNSLPPTTNVLPFYFWLTLGVAAGIVLTRGLR